MSYSNEFNQAIEILLPIEGGYVNNPNDPGGPTMYGITQATAARYGYAGDMRALPLELAQKIYKMEYWDKLNLDAIASISFNVAYELFDTGVNQGIYFAGKFLQRAINCCHECNEIALDGIIGSLTASSFKIIYANFPELTILKLLNAQQCVRYMEIVEANSSMAYALKGWIAKRIGAIA